MASDLLTRAGCSGGVDEKKLVRLLETKHYYQFRKYVEEHGDEMPIICYLVRHYLDALLNTDPRRVKIITSFGKRYGWDKWKSLGIN